MEEYSNEKNITVLIDCDVMPSTPANWVIEEHQAGGKIEIDLQKISLYLSPNQSGEGVSGNDLRKELLNKPVLNANVLDYLLAHKELIPKEWEGKYIYFWGTIYRGQNGNLCVRCLSWRKSKWNWNYRWLDRIFYTSHPIARMI